MANVINWFQIPVTDFTRARIFYEKLFNHTLYEMMMEQMQMGFFPMEGDGVGGAIVKGEGAIASPHGTLVYINAGKDLNDFLERIEPAGGKILVPKTLITPEIGYFALFSDTEGNTVGLHSLS